MLCYSSAVLGGAENYSSMGGVCLLSSPYGDIDLKKKTQVSVHIAVLAYAAMVFCPIQHIILD